jgi:hypothetical protein
MKYNATGVCPICGEEVPLKFWEERHRVHNGIGMQTVAVDNLVEPREEPCCDWSSDQWRELTDNAQYDEDDEYRPF